MSNKNSTGGAFGGTNVPGDDVPRRDLRQRVIRIITDMVDKVFENMWRDSSNSLISSYAFDLDVDSDEFKFIKRHAAAARAIELDSGRKTELNFHSMGSFVRFLDSIDNGRWTGGGGGGYSGPSLTISSEHPFKIHRSSDQFSSTRVTYHFTKGW